MPSSKSNKQALVLESFYAFDPSYKTRYTTASLRKSLNAVGQRVPQKWTRADVLVLFSSLHRASSNYDELKLDDRKLYDDLLERYQQAQADYRHCDLLQTDLQNIKDQTGAKINQVTSDDTLNSKEKNKVVAELRETIDQIEPELERLEESKTEHAETAASVQEQHASDLPPEAPPLFAVQLNPESHTLSASGNATIEPLTQERCLEEENEFQCARRRLKNPKKLALDQAKETENQRLLRLITEGKNKLKHRVHVKHVYEDNSKHGLLMKQIHAGFQLKHVEPNERPVYAKEAATEESTGLFGLGILGLHEKKTQRTRQHAKRGKSAKRASSAKRRQNADSGASKRRRTAFR